MTAALAARFMSTSSRKYQEVVEKGKALSPSSWPCAPEPGGDRYEVCNALACQVMGPLSPTTWKLTASLRPLSSGVAAAVTKGRATASLTTLWPGATVTPFWPPNSTGWLVPLRMALPLSCKPTNAPSKVTGLVPKALDSGCAPAGPQASGRTIRRNDWSRAPCSGEGKANLSSGWAVGLPTG